MKPSYHNMKMPMVKGLMTYPCKALVNLRVQLYGRIFLSEVQFNNEEHVRNYVKMMFRKNLDVVTIEKLN
jgi:hypothetical protein